MMCSAVAHYATRYVLTLDTLWMCHNMGACQSALLLGAFGPHTEDKRAFMGVIQLLQDPARTISKAAVLTGKKYLPHHI